MKFPLLLPLALSLLGHASAANLTAVLTANKDQLSTLNDTISRIPGAVDRFNALKNVTIFAPSNDAFKRFQKANPNFTALTSDDVNQLLLYHAVPNTIMSTGFTVAPVFLPTLLTLAGPNVTAGPSAAQKLSLQLTDTTKATIFSGFKQKAIVTTPNIAFNGGIIHIISAVLTLPGTPSATAKGTAGLSSFYGALNKTSLLAALDKLADATVFAPNDAGFEAIASVVSAAKVPELTSVLNYHVLKAPGQAVFSPVLAPPATVAGKKGLQQTVSLATLDAKGGNVSVREDVDTGNLFVNSAKIVTSDIITSNGVIHVLDNVLNPATPSAVPDEKAAKQKPAFTGATPATAAPFATEFPATPTFTPAPTTGAAGPFAAVPTGVLLAGGLAAMWANM